MERRFLPPAVTTSHLRRCVPRSPSESPRDSIIRLPILPSFVPHVSSLRWRTCGHLRLYSRPLLYPTCWNMPQGSQRREPDGRPPTEERDPGRIRPRRSGKTKKGRDRYRNRAVYDSRFTGGWRSWRYSPPVSPRGRGIYVGVDLHLRYHPRPREKDRR